MRFLLFILLCIFSLNTFAYDHSYNVSGENEHGKPVEGTIYSNNGERNVTGELTDENGDIHNFEGRWDGYGRISGETDDGASVDLSTN